MAKKVANEIAEWKLVFSPKNEIFENLVAAAGDALGLDGVLGVDNENDIEAVITNRKFVAGINFEHSAVRFKIFNILSSVSNELFLIFLLLEYK